MKEKEPVSRVEAIHPQRQNVARQSKRVTKV